MKNFVRVILMALMSAAVFTGCKSDNLVEPVLLELDRSNMKMTVGQSQKLNAVLKGSDEECIWKTADASVAEVEQNGLVTAVSPGKTVITVQAGDAFKECKVEVVDFKADILELNDDIQNNLLIVNVGQNYQLQPKFYKAGEKVNDMAYPVFEAKDQEPSRTGEEVASIDNEGLIRTLAPGKVTITVLGAGITKSFTLMVKEITLDKTSLQLFVQESAALSVAVLPESLPESEKIVEWYSSDKGKVSVDAQGTVRALKVTSSPVEVSAVLRNVTLVCKVTVAEFAAHSVSFTDLDEKVRKNAGKYEMYVGDSPAVLSAVFKDAAGNDVSAKVTNRTFASSSPAVASISENGELKPLSSGKTTVTVAGAGVEDSFELNVYQGVESLEIDPSGTKVVFNGDEPFTVSTAVYPENASVKTVTFASDKPEVASVDSRTGIVRVHRDGVARITATTDGFKRPVKGADGNYIYESLSATLLLTVFDKNSTGSSKVSITADNITDGTLVIQKGSVVQLTAVPDPSDYNGKYTWMVTNDLISVDETGRLTALAVGSSTVAVLAASDAWGTAMGELPVSVTGINPTAIEIVNGERMSTSVAETPVTLQARVTAPSNADFSGVNWYSSNENIVKVDPDGRLSYVGVGKAVITAKAKTWDGLSELSGVSDTFEIEIANAAITDFDIVYREGGIIISDRYYVEEGGTITLGYETVPMGAIPSTVTWTSGAESYATVSANGVVSGRMCDVPSGNDVIITCIIDGQIERNFTVTVVKKQPEDILVTLPGRVLKIGETWNLEPKVVPEYLGLRPSATFVTGATLTDSGLITPHIPGTISFGFYISRTQEMIKDLVRYYSVGVEPYWVESISIPSALNMEVGSSSTLSVTFTSDVAGHQPTYTDVKWSTDNPEILSVNERTGEIKALKPGEANVTVISVDEWAVPAGLPQKSATCRVTVKESAQALNVGDYYYSDGTWSSVLDSSKEVIGVVFAKVNPASSDLHLAKDYPDCTHGLVVSTEEYTSAFATGRGWSYVDLGNWMTGNGYTQFFDNDKPAGYSNTKGFIAANAASIDSYGAIIDFTMFNAASPVAVHRKNVPVPSSASGWYVPSFREMQLLHDGMAAVNSSLKAASGVEVATEYPFQYWCSSVDLMNKSVKAVTMNDGQWMSTSKTEGSVLPVRIILAF